MWELLNQPNLLLIVKRSKNIEVSDSINPNIINDFDFSLFFLSFFLIEDELLSLFLLIKFEKGLVTLKNLINN